jgi:PPK2 family polyphosphate:nucleotide phosphotransferase
LTTLASTRPLLQERLRVIPGQPAALAERDPGDTLGWTKEEGERELKARLDRLDELQERLWAEGKHGLLVILQGMDASGKDGTIRKVAGAFDPQGVKVTSFKVPTEAELGHDFLWRIHQHTPGKGEVAIFNRSHYEDVLVVRVHGLVPEETWRGRYDRINAFEANLAAEGTTVVKFFLAISREEQKERFQARLEDPTRRWKFRRGDVDERRLWDDYQAAYEEALTRCSTQAAGWYVIPGDHKWFRNLAVATILDEVMTEMDPQYPEPEEDLDGLVID